MQILLSFPCRWRVRADFLRPEWGIQHTVVHKNCLSQKMKQKRNGIKVSHLGTLKSFRKVAVKCQMFSHAAQLPGGVVIVTLGYLVVYLIGEDCADPGDVV